MLGFAAIGAAILAGDAAEVVETGTDTVASFSPFAPLVWMKNAIKIFHTDPSVKSDAFAGGNWVEKKTGSKLLGAVTAAVAASLISIKRAILGKGEWGNFAPPHPDFHYIKVEQGTVIVGPGAESMQDPKNFPGKALRYQ